MLRSAGKLFGTTAAGVAASGPATQSQCRAQQQKFNVHHGKEDSVKCVLPSNELVEDWLVTDLKRTINDDEVIFGPEEINDTLQTVLDLASGPKQPVGGSVRIQELDCESESSEGLDGSDANLHIQAAEMQLTARSVMGDDFQRMLSKLLHSQDVQSACVKTLKDDPAFHRMLDNPDLLPINIPMRNLLPPTAEQAAGSEDYDNDFNATLRDLANCIIRIGESVRQKAVEARDAVGKFLIKLGYSVHQILGKPFGSTPCEETDPDTFNRKAEMVGNALVTVACAILTLVLLKRVHRVRFV